MAAKCPPSDFTSDKPLLISRCEATTATTEEGKEWVGTAGAPVVDPPGKERRLEVVTYVVYLALLKAKMNAMFGTRSFLRVSFRPPFQGLKIFSFGDPGRCPGLSWIAPLGLRCVASSVVRFTTAA